LLSETNLSSDDFLFFACMVIDPEALITNRTARVQSLQQIIEDARAKSGKQKWLGSFTRGRDI